MSERRTRFEAVFQEVYEPLQRYARRRTDAATADDVVADTLLVMWRRLDDLPDGMALAWSYGIARRCLANRRRGAERQVRLADRLLGERGAGYDGHQPPEPDPVLHDALGDLEVDDRELVRLWAWEELQPREIAVVLGITPNAASIRLHRARKRLADAVRRKSHPVAGHSIIDTTPIGSTGDAR